MSKQECPEAGELRSRSTRMLSVHCEDWLTAFSYLLVEGTGQCVNDLQETRRRWTQARVSQRVFAVLHSDANFVVQEEESISTQRE